MAKKKAAGIGSHVPHFSLSLKPETKRSIYAILAGVAAVLFMLAALGQGGPAGKFIYDALHTTFGVGYFLIPVSLLFVIVGLVRQSESENVGGTRFFGAGILFLAGIALFSIFGDYGGLAGHYAALPFTNLFDWPLASIILAGISIVGLLLALDTPIGIPSLATLHLPFGAKKIEGEKTLEISDPYEEEPYEPTPERMQKEKPLKRPEPKLLEEEVPQMGFAPIDAAYTPPPLSLLDRDKGKPETGDIKANANKIKRTLQNFGINVEMDEVSIGPSVTRYALKPAEGVRLQKILGLQNNLELALAAHPVRIEAPIPGKSLVGIEVPNMRKATVGLGSLLSDEKFQNDPRPLVIALGRDIAGASHFANIGKMPPL